MGRRPGTAPVLLLALVTTLAGCGGGEDAASLSRDAARAVDVATGRLLADGASGMTLVGTRRGVVDCQPPPCPTVWWVTFRATTPEREQGTAVAVVDAKSFAYLYVDWTVSP